MPSAVIKFHSYDDKDRILTIGFVSGTKYRYLDVPPEIYRSFKSAFSKGHFFSEHILDVFKYRKALD